jgi:transcriptional regulator with XRE-family HTH domain
MAWLGGTLRPLRVVLTTVDRVRLAQFLRSRREALRPEDVGLPARRPGRTPGLRRDEVAELSGISTGYYTRLEQPRGPLPSAQVVAAVARGLRLDAAEHDHLLLLSGHAPPPPVDRPEVSLGLRRIFDRLQDEPSLIVDDVGETLLQTPPARALLGDETQYTGLMRSRVYRWFTDPEERRQTPPEDHADHSRTLVAKLTHAAAVSGPGSRADGIVARLRDTSPEFEELWREHPVAGPYCATKRMLHDEVGEIVLHGQTLLDPELAQALTVFTADPGSESERRLARLSGRVGDQHAELAEVLGKQA